MAQKPKNKKKIKTKTE